MTEKQVARFWSWVDKSGDCWVWTGVRRPKVYGYARGYGQVSVNQKLLAAHRVSWQLPHGPIPEGLQVCHRCDNPPCVRPDHLFLGTSADNRHDAVVKGRAKAPVHPRRTECRQGHPYDEANTYWTANGVQACRTCRRQWSLASYHRRKALERA